MKQMTKPIRLVRVSGVYDSPYFALLDNLESKERKQIIERITPIWDRYVDKKVHLYKPEIKTGKKTNSEPYRQYQEPKRVPHKSFVHVLTYRDIEILLAIANINSVPGIMLDTLSEDPLDIMVHIAEEGTEDKPEYRYYRQLVTRYLQLRDVEVGLYWGDIVVSQEETSSAGGNDPGRLIYDGVTMVKLQDHIYNQDPTAIVPPSFEVITQSLPIEMKSGTKNIPIEYWFEALNGHVWINTGKLDVINIEPKVQVQGQKYIKFIGGVDVSDSDLINTADLRTPFGLITVRYDDQTYLIIIKYTKNQEYSIYHRDKPNPDMVIPTSQDLFEGFRVNRHFRVDETMHGEGLSTYFLYWQYQPPTEQQKAQLDQERQTLVGQLPNQILLPELLCIVGEYVV